MAVLAAQERNNSRFTRVLSQPRILFDDQVVCTNLSTGGANRCWDELQLTQWAKTGRYNKHYETEGFSTYFLRLNGFSGLDCSQIAPQRLRSSSRPKPFDQAGSPSTLLITYTVRSEPDAYVNITKSSWYSNQSVLLFLMGSTRQFWMDRCGQYRNNRADDRRFIYDRSDCSGFTACAPEHFRAHPRSVGSLRSSQRFRFHVAGRCSD